MIEILLALQIAGAAPDSVALPLQQPDRWLSEDKIQHFTMSYAVTAFAYAGTRSILSVRGSQAVAITTAMAAGLLKEVYDRRRGRPFSARDLIWDAAGVAVGFVVINQIQ